MKGYWACFFTAALGVLYAQLFSSNRDQALFSCRLGQKHISPERHRLCHMFGQLHATAPFHLVASVFNNPSKEDKGRHSAV
jgi:hypothetical protein